MYSIFLTKKKITSFSSFFLPSIIPKNSLGLSQIHDFYFFNCYYQTLIVVELYKYNLLKFFLLLLVCL